MIEIPTKPEGGVIQYMTCDDVELEAAPWPSFAYRAMAWDVLLQFMRGLWDETPSLRDGDPPRPIPLIDPEMTDDLVLERLREEYHKHGLREWLTTFLVAARPGTHCLLSLQGPMPSDTANPHLMAFYVRAGTLPQAVIQFGNHQWIVDGVENPEPLDLD